MPILWRYLFKEYLKIFFLSIFAFISILLITRLRQIAVFTTLSSNFVSSILFVLYQIPYILPIAIAISSLISSIILFQKMSSMHELTAFRTCGISLKEILAPLFSLAIILSIVNFFIVSELTPRCRYKSKELFYKNTSMNPLVLLQRREKMSNIKDSYIEITSLNNDLTAKDILIITPNKSNERLSLLKAEKINIKDNNLIGSNISLISYINSNRNLYFDNLMIENQSNMTTKADSITQFIKSKEWDLNITSMTIKPLLIHCKQKINKKITQRAKMEISRRFSFALSTLSFTFIGSSFGISIRRKPSRKNIINIFYLSLLVLFSFTLGKALKKHLEFSILSYFVFQIITIIISSFQLKKISRGLE